MRIAVDAAGGDYGPPVIVAGAVAGARRFGVGLLLTGPEADIRRALSEQGQDASGLDIIVADAPEIIGGDEQPAQAVRRKPRSAIAVALDAVRDGRAAALVSAGN
ncbi:MAG: phosphate acyltransferase PlsX, partial [Thermomicrobiales bacterium]